MSNRNPPDPNGDAKHLRVSDFCDALLQAGKAVNGSGLIRWRPFLSRAAVERELERRGQELIEECANHDPTLKRFFAMQRIQPK